MPRAQVSMYSVRMLQGDEPYREDRQFLLYEFIDLGTVADGLPDLLRRIVDDLFQLLHELVVLDHLFIQDLQLFDLEARKLFGELLLKVFLVLAEGGEIIIMEDNVGKLGIELVLIEITMYFLQIGE
jgi:hypothetical protein